MSACNDVPISESFEQIKLQIADLVNRAGGLPKPQVQRVLQLAIDADTLRKT